MRAGFQDFDPAFMDTSAAAMQPTPRLRRRKTIRQTLGFYLANLLVLPVVCIVYATIIADGIRLLMPVFQRRLYTLPVPGAGLARNYDGWDRADLAILVAILLFVVVSWLWNRFFTELQGFGTIAAQRRRSPILFHLLLIITGVIVVVDAAIFYVGLSSQSDGWSDASGYVVPAATLIYTCGLALIGWWHSDFHTSRFV